LAESSRAGRDCQGAKSAVRCHQQQAEEHFIVDTRDGQSNTGPARRPILAEDRDQDQRERRQPDPLDVAALLLRNISKRLDGLSDTQQRERYREGVWVSDQRARLSDGRL
jgi:hypothetical protein